MSKRRRKPNLEKETQVKVSLEKEGQAKLNLETVNLSKLSLAKVGQNKPRPIELKYTKEVMNFKHNWMQVLYHLFKTGFMGIIAPLVIYAILIYAVLVTGGFTATSDGSYVFTNEINILKLVFQLFGAVIGLVGIELIVNKLIPHLMIKLTGAELERRKVSVELGEDSMRIIDGQDIKEIHYNEIKSASIVSGATMTAQLFPDNLNYKTLVLRDRKNKKLATLPANLRGLTEHINSKIGRLEYKEEGIFGEVDSGDIAEDIAETIIDDILGK